MKRKVVLSAILFFVLTAGMDIFAQTQSMGKVFNKTFADTVFGKVYYSKTISVAKLDSLLSDSTDVLMFKVTAKELVVLNKVRITLYPDKRVVEAAEPYIAYSKDKIKELLDKSKDITDVIIETRGSTTTLTSGNYTLEQGGICPPICP